MKFKILLVLLFVFGYAIQIMAQSKNDHPQVLQKCIDIPELQEFYPRDVKENLKQLYVMQHGISFPETINVSKSGKALMFLEKNEIVDKGINAFFLFRDFNVSQDSASVAFVYYFNFDGSYKDFVAVELELKRAGDTWSVAHSKIQRN